MPPVWSSLKSPITTRAWKSGPTTDQLMVYSSLNGFAGRIDFLIVDAEFELRVLALFGKVMQPGNGGVDGAIDMTFEEEVIRRILRRCLIAKYFKIVCFVMCFPYSAGPHT